MGVYSLLETIWSQWPILLLLAIGSVYYFVRVANKPCKYFADRGIPFKKPVPILGSMAKLMFRQESLYNVVLNSYNEFKDKRMYGIFDTVRTLLVIRDPELIKQITVKDFEHFLDHRSFISDLEPMFGKSLFMLTGQRWRDMRATLSPAFTGSKMRQMFQLVGECAEQTSQFLLKKAKASPTLEATEMKDLFTRFTSDVIATSAFGIKVNSLENPQNEFYTMGKKSTDFGSLKDNLKFLIFTLMPKLSMLFRMRLFSAEQSQFYHDLVHGTIKRREKEGIVRPDMINLLMEAQKGSLKRDAAVDREGVGFATVDEVKSEDLRGSAKQVWDDDDVTAQCFLFFLAGFDTSSSLLCFAAHELMENQDVQRTLIEELDEFKAQLNGKPLTYDDLPKMKYLDMVVSESLRKWPPAFAVDRECIKPYVIENNEGRKIEIQKGDGVWIPILGLHRDPEYYPEPDRFDPERFSDERKGSIQPCTYIPFGSGPRNCIGSRFALMECKAILYYLLTNFTFEVAPTSTIPLRIANSGFSVKSEKGFNIILKPRFV